MRPVIIVLLAAGLLHLVGCSDDSASPQETFAVTVRVVDVDGKPLPDIDLLTVMDSPYYMAYRAADKALTRVEWEQPVAAPVTVTIEDAAGGLVRKLFDGAADAGRYIADWNGQDEDGSHQMSGLYWVRLVVRADNGATLGDQRQPMYMALLDFERGRIGTTDEAGKVVITDRRLFPALYGDVEMDAVDESGDPIGLFPLTNLMRFYLREPGNPSARRYDREVTHAGQVIELVWLELPPKLPAAQPRAAAKDVPVGELPEGFVLHQPYPNPFN